MDSNGQRRNVLEGEEENYMASSITPSHRLCLLAGNVFVDFISGFHVQCVKVLVISDVGTQRWRKSEGLQLWGEESWQGLLMLSLLFFLAQVPQSACMQ